MPCGSARSPRGTGVSVASPNVAKDKDDVYPGCHQAHNIDFTNIDVVAFHAHGRHLRGRGPRQQSAILICCSVSAAAQTERRFDSCTCLRVLDGYRLKSSGRGLGVRPPAESDSPSIHN